MREFGSIRFGLSPQLHLHRFNVEEMSRQDLQPLVVPRLSLSRDCAFGATTDCWSIGFQVPEAALEEIESSASLLWAVDDDLLEMKCICICRCIFICTFTDIYIYNYAFYIASFLFCIMC